MSAVISAATCKPISRTSQLNGVGAMLSSTLIQALFGEPAGQEDDVVHVSTRRAPGRFLA